MSSNLRKSCDLCAQIKVGCSKEKPTCARCAKRKKTCVYSAAKRVGRSSGHGSQGSKEERSALIPTTPVSPTLATAQVLLNPTTAPSTPSGAAIFSPSSPDLGRPQSSLSQPSTFQTLIPLTDDTSLSSMPSTSFAEWDELFTSAPELLPEHILDGDPSGASLFDFAGLEDFSDLSSSTNHSNSSNITNISSRSSGSCLFPGSSKQRANIAPTPKAPTAPASPNHSLVVARPDLLGDANIRANITEGLQAEKQPSPSEPSSHQCLARVLGLLARVCPGMSGLEKNCDNPDENPSSAEQLPDFERIVVQNEQISEVIRSVLQCSCSNDSYLLIMLSLVVFKIITWYTAAARAASGEEPIPSRGASFSSSAALSAGRWQSSHYHQNSNYPFEPKEGLLPTTSSLPSPSPQSSLSTNNNNQINSEYDSEGEDQHRIAAQRILSKLARVQVSVDELSDRLKRMGDSKNSARTKNSDDTKTMVKPSPPLQENGSASTHGSTAGCSLAVGEDAFTRPFSAQLAHTLEADLRKRLYELSQAIVEKLRGG